MGQSTHTKVLHDIKTWASRHLFLSNSATEAGHMPPGLSVDEKAIQEVVARYPMRINPYYLSLIRHPFDPIWMQAVPDPRELRGPHGVDDPLEEERMSPVANLVHKYPDRVLFLVSNQCAVFCRFCNRKRKVGRGFTVNKRTLEAGLHYIRRHKEIRDVLLSGGDPLLLPDKTLEGILSALREIPHVEIIRIGSRVPCTLPQRITHALCRILKRYHPLFLITHFNRPLELTPEAKRACSRLADAGISLGCQTVLLKGVNDRSDVLIELMQGLLTMRVRPYYLFQAELVKGTSHFRTTVARGIEIVTHLRRATSGLCLPHYVMDLPNRGGKVPLLPPYILGEDGGNLLIRDDEGNVHRYPSI